MEEYGLGPNGAMLYCMEYLEENFDWLEESLAELEGGYFVFDIAGQVSSRRVRRVLEGRDLVREHVGGVGRQDRADGREERTQTARTNEAHHHLSFPPSRPRPSPSLVLAGRAQHQSRFSRSDHGPSTQTRLSRSFSSPLSRRVPYLPVFFSAHSRPMHPFNFAASSRPPIGRLLPHRPLQIYLRPPPLSPNDAPARDASR